MEKIKTSAETATSEPIIDLNKIYERDSYFLSRIQKQQKDWAKYMKPKNIKENILNAAN